MSQTRRSRTRRATLTSPAGVYRGFTIIDLLVSIAVVAILISILAPNLMKSYEMARRVVCMSNVRQIGYGLDMYLDDHDGEMPESVFLPDDIDETDAAPQNSIFLRLSSTDNVLEETGVREDRAQHETWDGLGHLFEYEYLNHPGAFYCPSHRGEHGYERYRESWASHRGTIAGNFQFRLDSQYRFREQLPERLTLLADSMRTQLDYNHVDGNNLLRADMSVEWYQDYGDVVYNNLAGPDTSAATMQDNVEDAWKTLDEDSDFGPPMAPDAPMTAGTFD